MDFEKLGVFYLGKRYDLGARKRTDDLVLYDSRDLVTHAVCVGMTGSGKTGLCLALIEEAAIDGVPAILIDPKGDLGNLLLTFPSLAPAIITGFALAFARGVGEYGSVIFIAGNLPKVTEIAPLLIVIRLEEFNYAAATAIAAVMLAISFAMLLIINLLQAWSRKRYG